MIGCNANPGTVWITVKYVRAEAVRFPLSSVIVTLVRQCIVHGVPFS